MVQWEVSIQSPNEKEQKEIKIWNIRPQLVFQKIANTDWLEALSMQ